MANELRVLLADDHEILRSGLNALLGQEANLAVVGNATDGREAVRLAKALRPDVIVMDLMMPQLNGIDATRMILEQAEASGWTTRVICLTGRSDERTLSDALAAGAVGVVRKESAYEELVAAIRATADGERYISEALHPILRRAALGPLSTAAHLAVRPLSSREREVLQLIAEGKATKEVARTLGVSTKTVETHRANLMEKLQLFTVADPTKYAIREGVASLA